MADDYEELVELGFEGIDKFATHFHDPVFGYVRKHKPCLPRSKRKYNGGPQPDQRQRELPKQKKSPSPQDSPQQQEYPQQRELPPHPQWYLPPPSGPSLTGVPFLAPGQLPPGPLPPPRGQPAPRQPPRQRFYSEPRGEPYDSRSVPDSRYESDSDSDGGRASRSMYSSYASNRRRDDGWRDEDRYEKTVEEREYYRPNGTAQQVEMRTRDAHRYQELVPRAPSPPSDFGYGPRVYTDSWAVRGRPLSQRERSSSWSSPRRPERRYNSPPRRGRSKSPNHHRALATVVGALVGGAAGSHIKRDDSGVNTLAMVGGAIIGGIAGSELEQEFDRHKERREHRAYERGKAREKRRLERQYNYD